MYSVPYHESENERLNKMYEEKHKHAVECMNTGNINGYLVIFERPYRLEAFIDFIEFHDDVTDKDYWESLGWIYTDSENIHAYADVWRKLFTSDRPERELIMDAEERERLATGLPAMFTVWRGYDPFYEDHQMSWTLNKHKAEFFAKRYQKDGELARAVVNKSDIIAYFNSRGEEEIVIMPDKLVQINLDC